MSQRLRSFPVPEGGDLSALMKLDMALAAREVFGAPSGDVSPHPLRRLVEELSLRAPASSSSRLMQAFEHMLSGKISPEFILDIYLPEVARRMGCGWDDDEVSWTDVTISCTRLQSVLRRFDPIWQDHNPAGSQPACLVALPDGAQHTLGAMLYASQLRRQGLHVQVELSLDAEKMSQLVAEKQYSAIFLSASPSDNLETLSGLVNGAKRQTVDIPVVVGGSALSLDPRFCARIGADFATTDLNEALSFCDLPDFYLSKPRDALQVSGPAHDSRNL